MARGELQPEVRQPLQPRTDDAALLGDALGHRPDVGCSCFVAGRAPKNSVGRASAARLFTHACAKPASEKSVNRLTEYPLAVISSKWSATAA